MVDCAGFPALEKTPSVTVGKRVQVGIENRRYPHINSYPQVLVHNALCASSGQELFAV